tara:strand:+ start:79 stop:312 length:234 start_codon:yes stop_codon:yes gene_type:complete
VNKLKDHLDPNNDISTKIVDDGADIECTYKGDKVRYNDMLDIYEERATNLGKGKPRNTKKYFGGWGEGTLNKARHKK